MPAAPSPHGDPALCARVEAWLDAEGVAFEALDHPPLSDRGSAAHAAELRGTPLQIGGKALVLKANKRFVVAAFSAARRMDSRALRKALGVRRLRFATTDELADLTGLVPGSVPPLGPPILNLPLYADISLLDSDRVAFTPGVLTRSLVVSSADWRRVAQPELLEFTTTTQD